MNKSEVLLAIENADDLFMSEIIETVIKRYSRVYPGWEVMFLTIDKDPQMRSKNIDAIIRFLNDMQNGEQNEG